jgi:hypothetical protein
MSTSWMLVGALWLFILIHGFFTHRSFSRDMRSRGETPPTFLAFFLAPFKRHSVSMPRPIRLVLGVAFIFGAIGLGFLAGSVVFKAATTGVRYPLIASGVVLVVVLIALGIAFVGVRLIQMKRITDSLLRPPANGAV